MRRDLAEDEDLAGEEPNLAERLSTDCPVPAPGFRGILGRYLAAQDPGFGTRPPALRLTAALFIAAGTLLMALAALSASGAL